MNRPISFYRHNRIRVIKRKKKIIKEQHNYWYVQHDGILSKGKIHCSCPLCRHKSYDEAKMQDKHSAIRDLSQLDDISDTYYVSKEMNKILNRTKRLY